MSTQKTSKEQALVMVQTINEMSNPFLDNPLELLLLDTWNVIDESVVNTVHTLQAVGRDQYDTYYMSVVSNCTRSIHEPIKKNSMPLLRCPTPKAKTKQVGQISMLKADVALFS